MEQLPSLLTAHEQYEKAVADARAAIKQWFTTSPSQVLTQESVNGLVAPVCVSDMIWDDPVFLDIVKADKDGIYTETGYLKPWDHLNSSDFMKAARWVYDSLNAEYFEGPEDFPEENEEEGNNSEEQGFQ